MHLANNTHSSCSQQSPQLTKPARSLSTRFMLRSALALAISLSLTACASNGQSKTTAGAIIGAVAGAAAGSTSSDSKGALYGAIAGALIGSAVGNYMDRQQREIEQQLADEIAANEVEIQRLEDDTLRVSLSHDASFDFDSAELKPAFLPALDRLGNLMQKYEKTALHIIGHTDSTGTESYNQQLSRNRAVSVARYVRGSGIDQKRFNVEGRGELEPRNSNDYEEGRQLNRRVEIYIRPIVEGQQDQAFESPAYS